MFVDLVYERLVQGQRSAYKDLHLKDVRIGTLLAGVELSDGSIGVASVVQSNELHQVEKKDRDFGEFSPLQICGRTLEDLFTSSKGSTTINVLKTAVLNAIFQKELSHDRYGHIAFSDPIDLVDLSDYQRIVMVGAFNSYISKIATVGAELKVLEMNEFAFLPSHKPYFVPAEQYRMVLPDADLVIITGLTLVNDTFSDLLQFIRPESKSIIIGPSASILPDLFFESGIDLVGALEITSTEKLMPLVSQGAAGYHLFKYCARKITLING